MGERGDGNRRDKLLDRFGACLGRAGADGGRRRRRKLLGSTRGSGLPTILGEGDMGLYGRFLGWQGGHHARGPAAVRRVGRGVFGASREGAINLGWLKVFAEVGGRVRKKKGTAMCRPVFRSGFEANAGVSRPFRPRHPLRR